MPVPFPPAVTATGGGATDERDFIWTVESDSFAGATFKINSTRLHDDDIGFIGQPLPAEMLEWGRICPNRCSLA